MKKIIVFLIIITFIHMYSALAVSKNEPLRNLSNGLDNITYGVIEIPDNIDAAGAKGSRIGNDFTDKTKDDVGRGIARIIRGIWKIATFWYPTD